MPPLTGEAKRKAFKQVSEREAKFRASGKTPINFNISVDARNLLKGLDGLKKAGVDVVVLKSSKQLAEEIFANRSQWPVYTSYSRGRFKGGKDGIYNDASYAGTVEQRTGAAKAYVEANLRRAAQKAIDGALKAF